MDNSILENYYDLEIKYNLIDLNQAESKKDYLGCFEPIMFADLKIKNRFVFSHLSDISLFESGAPKQSYFDFYNKISKTGVGIIFTGGIYAIFDEETINKLPSVIDNGKYNKMFIDLTKQIHTNGSKIFFTIKPGFGRLNRNFKMLNILKGSSSFNADYDDSRLICGRITDSKCNEIIQQIEKLSKFAKDTGFDGVMIDGSLDEVLGEFSSKEFNRRVFGYFADIYDLPVKVIQKVIKKIGKLPIVYKLDLQTFLFDVFGKNIKRVSTLSNVKIKHTINHAIELITKLTKEGVDCFYIGVGARETEFLKNNTSITSSGLFDKYINLILETIKLLKLKNKFGEEVKFIIEDDLIKNIKNNSHFINITKNIYSDTDFLFKKLNKKEPLKCIKCNKCIDFMQNNMKIECAINPRLYYEDISIIKIRENEKIAIVGAGISGIVCALTLAERGAKPELFEKNDIINQNGEICDVFGFDKCMKNYNNYIKCELLKNAKNGQINLKTNTIFEYDERFVKNYTSIVIATGFKEKFFSVNGAVQKHVKSIYEILKNKELFFDKNMIAIYAKSELALKLAIYLAAQKKKVSLIIPNLNFLFKMPNANLTYYLTVLKKYRVDVYLDSHVKKIHEDSAEIIINNKIKNLDFVSVVLNMKSKINYRYISELKIIDAELFIYEPELVPNNKLFYELVKNRFKGNVYLIGNALEIGDLYNDIHTGFYVGKNI